MLSPTCLGQRGSCYCSAISSLTMYCYLRKEYDMIKQFPLFTAGAMLIQKGEVFITVFTQLEPVLHSIIMPLTKRAWLLNLSPLHPFHGWYQTNFLQNAITSCWTEWNDRNSKQGKEISSGISILCHYWSVSVAFCIVLIDLFAIA